MALKIYTDEVCTKELVNAKPVAHPAASPAYVGTAVSIPFGFSSSVLDVTQLYVMFWQLDAQNEMPQGKQHDSKVISRAYVYRKLTKDVDYTVTATNPVTVSLNIPASSMNYDLLSIPCTVGTGKPYFSMLPVNALLMDYRGTAGTNIEAETPLWVKRDDLQAYALIQMGTKRLLPGSIEYTTYNGAAMAEGYRVNLAMLDFVDGASNYNIPKPTGTYTDPLNSTHLGLAVTHAGKYVGNLQSVTPSDYSGENNVPMHIQLDTAYTSVMTEDAVVRKVTDVQLSLADGITGLPTTWAPILDLPDITDGTIVKLWVKGTQEARLKPRAFITHELTLESTVYPPL